MSRKWQAILFYVLNVKTQEKPKYHISVTSTKVVNKITHKTENDKLVKIFEL